MTGRKKGPNPQEEDGPWSPGEEGVTEGWGWVTCYLRWSQDVQAKNRLSQPKIVSSEQFRGESHTHELNKPKCSERI